MDLPGRPAAAVGSEVSLRGVGVLAATPQHRAIAEAVAHHDEDAARAAGAALVQRGTERVLGLIEALRER